MASITRHKTGWRAQVARAGIRRSKVFATRQEAKDWAARAEWEILHSDQVVADMSLGDVLARYAREVSPTKRGGRWEEIRLAKIGRDKLAAVKLGALTATDFADWRDRRLKEVAPASVIRELQLLRSVLNTARKEWRLLSANPISDIRWPQKPPARDRLPTPDEIAAMQHSAGSDLTRATARAFHAFRFAMETAMRAGEIAALRPEDVRGRVARLHMTKNGRPRDVPLSSEALRLLAELPPDDPLFGLTSRQLDVLFRKLRDRAGVEGLTFHDSRHAAITMLARKLDVLALARMVGHTDLRMLQVYYNESADDLAARLT